MSTLSVYTLIFILTLTKSEGSFRVILCYIAHYSSVINDSNH